MSRLLVVCKAGDPHLPHHFLTVNQEVWLSSVSTSHKPRRREDSHPPRFPELRTQAGWLLNAAL